jgi:acyl carrier protein
VVAHANRFPQGSLRRGMLPSSAPPWRVSLRASSCQRSAAEGRPVDALVWQQPARGLSSERPEDPAETMPERDALIRRAQLMLARAYVAPRTPIEERLARIWRDVLGMDAVGVEDSYYDLGGDSFLAAVIFAQIEEEFSIDLPMATLIRSPTIAQLALKLQDALRASGG